MIIGTGIDLASIDFWSAAINDPTTSVIEGTFTEQELADARSGPADTAHRLASRFAAKEAFIKAISSSRKGKPPLVSQFDPRTIEVTKDQWGRPSIRLSGDAKSVAEQLDVAHIWVTLSHEDVFAVAMIVLESAE